jgi:transcriptional regulator with XRE-family HTH domain
MAIEQKIGNRIREFREKTGMSQEAAAFKAGYDRSYWGQIERGEKSITIVTLYDFICTVETTVAEFFSGEMFS